MDIPMGCMAIDVMNYGEWSRFDLTKSGQIKNELNLLMPEYGVL